MHRKINIFIIFLLSVSLLVFFFVINKHSTKEQLTELPAKLPEHYFSKVIMPSHLSQKKLDEQLVEFYLQWKQEYLVTVENSDPVQMYVFYNRERIAEPKEAVCCSEGQGYGMLISAFMADFEPDAKTDFDALYQFYKAHPSNSTPEFMAWQQIETGGRIVNTPDGGEYSATDGDMDIAYALLLADQLWGSEGPIDYRGEAVSLIEALMENAVNPEDSVLKLGNWVKAGDPVYANSTRLSDFMLEHIRVFASYDSQNADQWEVVYNKMTEVINEQYQSGGKTGLMPDFMVKDLNGTYVPAEPGFLEGEHDGDYHYNACRIPWRYSMDYIIGGRATVKNQLDSLNEWLKKASDGNPENIKSGYNVKSEPYGESYEEYGDLCFIAPLMVSAMIDPVNQEWLNRLWDDTAEYSIKDANYYDNSLKLLAMITASGHWISPNAGKTD